MEGVRRRDFALRLAQRSLAEFVDDRCPQLAASIAYHVLFSIFPLAIVLAAISGIVLHATGSQHQAVDSIVRNVPLSGSGRDQLRHLLIGATGNLSALGLFGLVGLLYSASGMMAAIRTALNEAWDVDETRPFLKGKLVDVGLVFLVALLGLASLGVTVALHVVGGGGWVAVSVVVPLVLGFAVVLFLYRTVPAADVRVGDVWPAALFVAVAFMAAQNLFAVYVGHFGNYNAVYGSLGAVIAFMFFVFLSSELFLLGAEVASEWPRVRHAFATGAVQEEPAGPPLGQQVREALLGLWVRRRQEEAGADDDSASVGWGSDRESEERGDTGVDPDGAGGDRDRGHPGRVAGGAGGRPADLGRDGRERRGVAGVRPDRGADRR
jgi:membrane protein